MDKTLLEKMLGLLTSKMDSDAVMGLRGLQNFFKSEGGTLEEALRYAAAHIDKWKSGIGTIDHVPATKEKKAQPVIVSGMPECRIIGPGVIELVAPGKIAGDHYVLPGEAARDAEVIAHNFKDAVVAAVINKSKFRLKLNDLKTETALQAEYERQGMTPVQIWVNNRGEVGALATVLRKAVAQTMPELAA